MYIILSDAATLLIVLSNRILHAFSSLKNMKAEAIDLMAHVGSPFCIKTGGLVMMAVAGLNESLALPTATNSSAPGLFWQHHMKDLLKLDLT
jgi:hypothetical protein